jgi:hypothetical protein
VIIPSESTRQDWPDSSGSSKTVILRTSCNPMAFEAGVSELGGVTVGGCCSVLAADGGLAWPLLVPCRTPGVRKLKRIIKGTSLRVMTLAFDEPGLPFDSFALSVTVERRAFPFPGRVRQAESDTGALERSLVPAHVGFRRGSQLRERDGRSGRHEHVRSIFSITYKLILGPEISRGLIGPRGESKYLGVEVLVAIRGRWCG